ncbi:MAG: hypothetical protein HQK84_01655 [Nitrospinae bacterium]|nr:hypothetical protein [Nitrospinota bacterium]
MSVRAIGLLSGGLDSTIAVKFMKEMGIDVIAVNFFSPFCTCTHKSSGCKSQAVKVAEEFDIPIKTYFQGEEYLKMIQNPKFGYGSQMNPCVDCRIMMFARTKEIMGELDAKFIFTGEVLGQRPMSQRKDSINKIDREAGVKGLVLRPLSAKHFNPTIPEKEGWVDREKLLDISGRSRKPQMELANELEIIEYQCASGGCLLTDKFFSNRLRDLFEYKKDVTLKDARLLKLGRQFRLSDNCKAIIGRDESENNSIEKYQEENDLLLFPENTKGPVTLLKLNNSTGNEESIKVAATFAAHYCKKIEGTEKVVFSLKQHNENKCDNIPETIESLQAGMKEMQEKVI